MKPALNYRTDLQEPTTPTFVKSFTRTLTNSCNRLPHRLHFFRDHTVQRRGIHFPLLLRQVQLPQLQVVHQVHRLSRWVFPDSFPQSSLLLFIGHDIDDAVVWTADAYNDEDDDQQNNETCRERYWDDELKNVSLRS